MISYRLSVERQTTTCCCCCCFHRTRQQASSSLLFLCPPNDETIIKDGSLQLKSIRSIFFRIIFAGCLEGGTRATQTTSRVSIPNSVHTGAINTGMRVCVWVCYSEAGQSLTFVYKNSGHRKTVPEKRNLIVSGPKLYKMLMS
jgi:hypothetical protein